MIAFKTTATMPVTVTDLTMIADAQQIVGRAEREGKATCTVPRWMLEALIEKATRDHD